MCCGSPKYDRAAQTKGKQATHRNRWNRETEKQKSRRKDREREKNSKTERTETQKDRKKTDITQIKRPET